MSLPVAFRSLLKTPGFTFLVIAVLALGIGANSAIFSVVNGVLLRPLRFHDPDRIVALTNSWKNGSRFSHVSGPDFEDWRDQISAFSAMARYYQWESSISAGGQAEYASVSVVSDGFFEVMGPTPAQGRLLGQTDQRKGAPTVVVVSDAFWRRHFAGQIPDGHQTIRALDRVFPIVGVLPAGFRFPGKTDIWIPTSLDPDLGSRSSGNFLAVARLKPGVSLQQAQAQMTTIAARLEKAYPASNKDKGAAVTLLRDYTVRNVGVSLYVLLGAVGLVLLIACANVANLLLAKATARSKEIAVRVALGASRRQLVSQLFLESVLIAFAAGAASLVLAYWTVDGLIAIAPKDVPRLDEASVDPRALAFTIAISALATLIFGLIPAWRASRVDPADALRQGNARGVVGGVGARLRQSFVVSEIALCVVLLISAGLVVRSLSSLLQTDLGFKTDSILTAEISPADAGPDDQRRIADSLFRPLQHQAAEIPGVQAAALTNSIPGQNHPSGSYIIDSQSMDKFTVSSPQAGFTVASTGYFEALGMHLLAGRDFAETDTLDAPPIAVISESLARSAFPGRDPVGHKIFCGLDEYTIKGQMTIVGVVNDAHMDGPAQPVTAELYVPATQHPRTAVTLLIKTTGAPERQIESVRRLVHGLNPSAAVRFNTVAALMSDVVASPRFTSILLSSFAAIALTLALIGVYAVMSYTVVQRSAEVGLRMALGAERAGVMRMILTQALRLAVVGGIIGLAGAFAATRLLRSLLFNLKPLDPVTYGLAILLLLISAVVASFWPAWRASRIDPMEALRQE